MAETIIAATKDPMIGSGTGAMDPLNYDNSSMILVSALLNGSNYLSWSRSMVLALHVKDKLGFINGKIKQPDLDSEEYEQWHKVDSMVISWILNAISKDLVEAFLYVTNSRELWTEISKRFGERNGPMLY